EKHGFTTENIYTMFIPNTYEIYWNVSPDAFFDKMYKEFDKFWTPERKQKATALGLDPQKAVILASIVDYEALYDKEMPTIAGLYLNRLRQGILLQADPTVIYANNDFTVKRVTGALLRVDSKYNTYKYAGLPPGPIMMPSIKAIDAVLNREKNNYIYMCAKEDFSGYHNFAETQEEHDRNAKKYRDALNKRNIYR
ncbi:MAG: endolytic transglycosylase MltG, partial [Pedobacter sp.]